MEHPGLGDVALFGLVVRSVQSTLVRSHHLPLFFAHKLLPLNPGLGREVLARPEQHKCGYTQPERQGVQAQEESLVRRQVADVSLR